MCVKKTLLACMHLMISLAPLVQYLKVRMRVIVNNKILHAGSREV